MGTASMSLFLFFDFVATLIEIYVHIFVLKVY